MYFFTGFNNKLYADITLGTAPLAAANINQGTNTNIVYIAQMTVTVSAATVNNIQITLSGTHDADDLVSLSIYYNATTPTIAGSFGLNTVAATFASPHTYNVSVSNPVAVGSAGYYIITVNVSPTATDNHTIEVNAATNPVVFGFTTAPLITDNQTDAAGIQTIQAADITLATAPLAAANINQGTNTNIVYIAQMSVATEPATVNSIQITLSGTHDADDLTSLSVFYNPNTPTIAGSFGLNTVAATFASPHTYNFPVNNTVTVGSAGYYIIAVNVSPTATIGNTVKIDGAANPVVFGFTTVPNITNNQTDNGGLHTLPVSFISLRAYEKSTAVNIEWKVTNEWNLEKYFVERSMDGGVFNAIGETVATGIRTTIMTYNLSDEGPLEGNNFYRIRALSKDGKIEYSPVVKINLVRGKAGISIYPNPAGRNGSLNLQLQNLNKGRYKVSIFNQEGQRTMKQEIAHEGGSSVQQIIMPGISTGLYLIEVSQRDIKFVKTIIVE